MILKASQQQQQQLLYNNYSSVQADLPSWPGNIGFQVQFPASLKSHNGAHCSALVAHVSVRVDYRFGGGHYLL